MAQGFGPPAPKRLPADVLDAISAAVSNAAVPRLCPSLDPLYPNTPDVQVTPPSAYSSPYWSEPVARKTLASLCLVNRDFRDAAKPWLWERIEVKFPCNWLGILDEVCGEDEEPATPQNIPAVIASDRDTIHTLRTPSSPITPISQGEIVQGAPVAVGKNPQELTALSPVASSSVPLDLLTPCPSRPPSPRMWRRRSSGRWRFIREVNRRIHPEPGLYGM